MSDIENKFAAKDLANMLGVEPVTVRKYAAALEKYGYRIVRSDGKNRSFSDTDVMVFRQLTTLRERSGMSVEMAAQVVATKNVNATKIVEYSDNSDSVANKEQYDERYEALASQVAILTQMLVTQQEIAAALPSPEEQRMDRLNDRLTERRIERQLEREALDLWSDKPEIERMKKISLFKRVENVEAKERFVRDYVDTYYEQRIKEEYGLI